MNQLDLHPDAAAWESVPQRQLKVHALSKMQNSPEA
jgi:hypothetical protein